MRVCPSPLQMFCLSLCLELDFSSLEKWPLSLHLQAPSVPCILGLSTWMTYLDEAHTSTPRAPAELLVSPPGLPHLPCPATSPALSSLFSSSKQDILESSQLVCLHRPYHQPSLFLLYASLVRPYPQADPSRIIAAAHTCLSPYCVHRHFSSCSFWLLEIKQQWQAVETQEKSYYHFNWGTASVALTETHGNSSLNRFISFRCFYVGHKPSNLIWRPLGVGDLF